jgi:hypothetical protein
MYKGVLVKQKEVGDNKKEDAFYVPSNLYTKKKRDAAMAQFSLPNFSSF